MSNPITNGVFVRYQDTLTHRWKSELRPVILEVKKGQGRAPGGAHGTTVYCQLLCHLGISHLTRRSAARSCDRGGSLAGEETQATGCERDWGTQGCAHHPISRA